MISSTSTTIKISLAIASVLFFNVLYNFIINHEHSLHPDSAVELSLDEFENNTTDLKGREDTFKHLSYMYALFFLFAYKSIREQIILFILFYLVLYLTYLPFNCFCKDAKFWTCKAGTSPDDEECRKVYESVKKVDDIIERDMKNIREIKTQTYESFLKLFIVMENKYSIPNIPDNLLEIPKIENDGDPIGEQNVCKIFD